MKAMNTGTLSVMKLMATQLTTTLADYIILEEASKMDERLIKLAHAIEETKELWEEFKTEEIRIYLEYLKELWSSLVE